LSTATIATEYQFCSQVKADLIRQREIELLKPSAGSGASEILNLLRPTKYEGTAVAVETEQVHADTAKQQISPRRWKLAETASFCTSAATLAAAAEAVFGPSPSAAASNGAVGMQGVAASETLVGLSCAISSSGEVNINIGSYMTNTCL
jgi:hypothetical protein